MPGIPNEGIFIEKDFSQDKDYTNPEEFQKAIDTVNDIVEKSGKVISYCKYFYPGACLGKDCRVFQLYNNALEIQKDFLEKHNS